MRSFFGYLESFRPVAPSLVSYKFLPNETPSVFSGLRRNAANGGEKNLLWIFCGNFRARPHPEGGKAVEWERFIFRKKFSRVWREEIPFRSNRNDEPRETIGPVILHHLPLCRGVGHLSNVRSTLISCFCTGRRIPRIYDIHKKSSRPPN